MINTHLRGAFFGMAAMGLYCLYDVTIKFFGPDYSPLQVLFCAGLVFVPLILVQQWLSGKGGLRPVYPGLTAVRVVARLLKGTIGGYVFSVLPPAEGYAVDLGQGYEEARQKMARQIDRDVRFDIGGDQQRVHAVDTDIRDVTFKHILLPVWLAAYKYRGQTYRFVVNGRTGRVQGERPWSAIKIAIAVVLGLIVAVGIGYLAAETQ